MKKEILLKDIVEMANDDTWIRLEGSSYLANNVHEFQAKDVKENDSGVMNNIGDYLDLDIESFRLGFVAGEGLPVLIVKVM